MFNLLFLREDLSLTWLGLLGSKLQEPAQLLLPRAGLIGVFHLCLAVEAGDLPKGLRLTLQGPESQTSYISSKIFISCVLLHRGVRCLPCPGFARIQLVIESTNNVYRTCWVWKSTCAGPREHSHTPLCLHGTPHALLLARKAPNKKMTR